MSRLERSRVEAHLGRKPELGTTLDCPVLNESGRCSAYAVRPMMCRLWGMVEAMRCPHGCEPERWLTDAEARDLLESVALLGGEMVMFGFDKLQAKAIVLAAKGNRSIDTSFAEAMLEPQ